MMGGLISLLAFGSVTIGAYLLLTRAADRLAQGYRVFRVETSRRVEQLFVFIPSGQLSAMTVGSAALIAGAAGAVTSGVPWAFRVLILVGAAVAGMWLPRAVLHRLVQRRLRRVDQQLVDGLGLLSNGLRAGLSFMQALDLVVKESPPPLSQEFDLVLREHKMGTHLEEALQHLLERVPSQDLHLLVTAVLLARETGGNLAEVFGKIATTIRERQRMRGRLDALTAQGKIQGVTVGLLPLALGGILYAIDPALMRPVLTTPPGWIGLGVVAVLEVAGYVMIRKIVTVEV